MEPAEGSLGPGARDQTLDGEKRLNHELFPNVVDRSPRK
jgi:hypothetical protein